MAAVAPPEMALNGPHRRHVGTDGDDRVFQTASTATAPASTSKSRVLLVDDDPILADMVLRYLRREGYAVEWLTDGSLVAPAVAADIPDLVVLDLLLPGVHGREVCRELREMSDVPILMLTALGEEADRVAGLEAGADDYLTKPLSPRELVLRVEAILRRAQPADQSQRPLLRDGDLLVDARSRVVRLRGEPVKLGTREHDLLMFFLRHPGEVFTRQQLLEHVWGWSYGDQSTVTVHVRRLREKIEKDPSEPQRVVTVWGVGYRYEPTRP